MFGTKRDPRDEIIALLREDKERLELRVAELTKQVIALASRAAYRELHPRPPAASEEAVPAVLDPRKATYTPPTPFKAIEEAFARRASEAKES
jgi:hypothetical protein